MKYLFFYLGIGIAFLYIELLINLWFDFFFKEDYIITVIDAVFERIGAKITTTFE